MSQRSDVLVPEQPLVSLQRVSKQFTMHRESQRSFQEMFIRLLQRQPRDAKKFWAIQDVSFEVHPGDCFGIIGPNGSGKSTLLKLITRILEPTSGHVATNGRIASLLELGAGFHPELTGRENIFLNGSVYGLSRQQMRSRVGKIIDFAELGDFIDVPIKHYSSGMHVRLGFAVAIHTDPDLLLVDEVLAVGDASFQQKCLNSIQKFRLHGGTLLFVSHDLGTIQSLCNRAIWLDHGKVRAAGVPTDVAMAYLNDVADRSEAQSASAPLAELSAGQRWGSGRIEITKVELRDATGAARAIFVNGGPFEVHLTYRAKAPVREPVFGLAIHHQNGVHVCGPNTRFSGLHIPYAEGEGEVVYTVPSLALLEGAYLLSVAAVDGGDSETFDYHDRAYPFRVAAGTSAERYGVVTLNGHWRVDATSEPAELAPKT